MTNIEENIERVEWTLQDPDWKPSREYLTKLLAAYKEAADEIERLTATADAAQRGLLREVERLTALVTTMANDLVKSGGRELDRLAEIERLQALVKEARQYVSDAGNDEDGETQKLSAALLVEIDRALEPKP